jgi:hypothetical protein
MRGCHKKPTQDIRHKHNSEMWSRPQLDPVVVPSRQPSPCPVAREAVHRQGVGD